MAIEKFKESEKPGQNVTNQKLLDEVISTKSQKDWTIAIEMAGDRSAGPGSIEQLRQLKELAAKTKNSSVAFVVDAVVDKNDVRNFDGSQNNSDAEKKQGGDQLSTEHLSHGHVMSKPERQRLLIKDGTIKELSNGDSEGIGKDISGLLQAAKNEAPSKKLGLIMNTHGDAVNGVSGYSGSLNTDEFVKAVNDGLQKSGTKQLDFLDFDACKMGNLSVMDKVSKISKHVVASEFEEFNDTENKQFFGQNMPAALSKLIDNPQMSGEELANTIVDRAKSGLDDGKIPNKEGATSGIATLAHYDLNQLDSFENSLNNMGKALQESIKNPQNLQSIENAIKAAPHPGDEDVNTVNRDLSKFANRIMDGIADGSINDIDGSLAKTTREMLEAQKKLIANKYGATKDGFDTWGSMSAFLPDLSLRHNGIVLEGTQTQSSDRPKSDEQIQLQKKEARLKAIFSANALTSASNWDDFLASLPH